ncbi:unnamed protein product, partial [Linum tenue]
VSVKGVKSPSRSFSLCLLIQLYLLFSSKRDYVCEACHRLLKVEARVVLCM